MDIINLFNQKCITRNIIYSLIEKLNECFNYKITYVFYHQKTRNFKVKRILQYNESKSLCITEFTTKQAVLIDLGYFKTGSNRTHFFNNQEKNIIINILKNEF